MARVCMIAYTHYPTDSRVRREAEALVGRGDTVDVICLGKKGEPSPEDYFGVRMIKVKIGRYRGSSPLTYIASYLQFFFITLFKLAYLHTKNAYQVIQVHTMPDFMVFAAIFPKLRGAKVLLDVHDLMPELYQSKFGFDAKHPIIRFISWMECRSIAFADRAISVHKPHLAALCGHGNPIEKFTVLLNLPDMKVFSPPTTLRLHNEPGLDLIYHGTVAKRNGLEIAIRAISTLKPDLKNLSLRIIGDGDDILRLCDLVAELELQDMVRIDKGMVPLEQLVPMIQNADAGVVPILYDEFTKYMLPVKLLEYVALGKPVICSKTETIEAYFDPSMVQFCTPGDVAELADAISILYKNPNKRRQLSEKADTFNQEYSWEKQKQIYYQLIDRLANGKQTN
jgi:glycosyltransferase involved in cell wall biosynthesis